MELATIRHLQNQLAHTSKLVVLGRYLHGHAMKGVNVKTTKLTLNSHKATISDYLKTFTDALKNYDNMHSTLKNLPAGQWWVYGAKTQEDIDALIDKLKKVCHAHRVKINAFNRQLNIVNGFIEDLC